MDIVVTPNNHPAHNHLCTGISDKNMIRPTIAMHATIKNIWFSGLQFLICTISPGLLGSVL